MLHLAASLADRAAVSLGKAMPQSWRPSSFPVSESTQADRSPADRWLTALHSRR